MIHWKSENNNLGVVSGFIRPKRNNEGNTDTFSFGKARPLKHYRRGYVNVANQNRLSKSSMKTQTIQNLIDTPGSYIAANQNTPCVGHEVIINQTVINCQDCNSDQKAKDRIKSASTILSKQYYTTLQEYRRAKCKTYQQNIIQYQPNTSELMSTFNCQKSCCIPIHKRNNRKHDVQGAVTASANINTIKQQELANSSIYNTNMYPFQPRIVTSTECCHVK